MATLHTGDPLAVALLDAVHAGDLPRLSALLAEHPGLATARFGDDDPDGMSRAALHLVTDWPGHFPDGAAVVRLLVEAGADVDARFRGPHTETPLHSFPQMQLGRQQRRRRRARRHARRRRGHRGHRRGDRRRTPLADARAFGQWHAAHRLVQRGAGTTITDAATLGLMDRLVAYFAGGARPPSEDVDRRSGARATAVGRTARSTSPSGVRT